MTTPQQIARHLREVHFGGNWTTVNLKDQLEGISWQHAITEIHSLNTIAALVYHINYYIAAIAKVLEGGALDAKDAYSFDHPPIASPADWDVLRNQVWQDAERLAGLIEQLPEHQLAADFTDPKYGSYHRNLLGVIEHFHYHLGQIALIKKLLPDQS